MGPYEACPACQYESPCTKCDGLKRILREPYREACRVLEVMSIEMAEYIILKGVALHGNHINLEYEKAAAVLELQPVPTKRDERYTSRSASDIAYLEDNRTLVYLMRAARET